MIISNTSLHLIKNSFKNGLNSKLQFNLISILLNFLLLSKELCINVSSKSNTKVLRLLKSLGPNHTFYQNYIYPLSLNIDLYLKDKSYFNYFRYYLSYY